MIEKEEIVQWGYDFLKQSYLNRPTKKLDHTEAEYYWCLYPFNQPFYNILNPITLTIENNMEAVLKRKVLMILDGIIPLIIFFSENKPNRKIPKIIIHKEFWFLVPVEWRAFVRYYEMSSNEYFNEENPPQKILMTGLLNHIFLDAAEFERELDQLITTVGMKNLEKAKISALFPLKIVSNPWGGWSDEDFLLSLNSLSRKINLDISFTDWEAVKAQKDHRGTLFFEFNRGHYLKETSVKNSCLSRGAYLLSPLTNNEPMKFEERFEVSFYHHVNLYSLDERIAPEYIPLTSAEQLFFFNKILRKGILSNGEHGQLQKWLKKYLKTVSSLEMQSKQDD